MSENKSRDSFETKDGYLMEHIKTYIATDGSDVARIMENAHALDLRVTVDVVKYINGGPGKRPYEVHVWRNKKIKGAVSNETD